MATPVQMPKQGNSVEECLIVEWNAAVGSAVSEGDTLCTIETDKASFEVPAPVGGTLLVTFADEGDLAPVLTNIAVIGEEGEDTASFTPVGDDEPAAAPAAETTSAPTPATAPAAPANASNADSNAVSPRARHLAERLGIDPGQVAGTGAKGRVTSQDVQSAADNGLAMTPTAVQASTTTGLVAGTGTGLGGRVRAQDLTGPTAAPMTAPLAPADDTPPTEIPYTGIRKLIGERMMASLNQQAQLTLNSSADASAILGFRKKVKASAEALGLPNITLNDMICYVIAKTLKRFPELNGLFDMAGGVFRQYHQVHLGIAVDTPRGLMVPNVLNAHALTLSGVSQQIAFLAEQCRSGSIDPDLLQGGTFTITNLGALGIESFTPVLNTPQVAILGICSIQQKAVPAEDGSVKWQPTLGLSLTIDHQVVDGAPASRFLKTVADGITNFDLLLAQ